jgi:hypothetical protein
VVVSEVSERIGLGSDKGGEWAGNRVWGWLIASDTAELQLEGHAAAITSPEIIAAIARNEFGCISIIYFRMVRAEVYTNRATMEKCLWTGTCRSRCVGDQNEGRRRPSAHGATARGTLHFLCHQRRQATPGTASAMSRERRKAASSHRNSDVRFRRMDETVGKTVMWRRVAVGL